MLDRTTNRKGRAMSKKGYTVEACSHKRALSLVKTEGWYDERWLEGPILTPYGVVHAHSHRTSPS